MSDAYSIARTVVDGISLFVLGSTAAIALSKRDVTSQSILKLKEYLFAFGFGLFAHAFTFADDLVWLVDTEIPTAYSIVEVVLGSTAYISGILVLVVIYSLLFQCLERSTGSVRSSTRSLLWAHYGFCGVLFAMFVAILGLNISIFVNRYQFSGLFPYVNETAYDRLDVALAALYLCAAIEILIGAIWLVTSARRENGLGSVPTLTLALVAIPLLIGNAFILAVDVVFEMPTQYMDYYFDAEAFQLAAQIIMTLCTNLVYIGFVVIGTNLDQTPRSFDEEDQQSAYGHNFGREPFPAMQESLYGVPSHAAESSPERSVKAHAQNPHVAF